MRHTFVVLLVAVWPITLAKCAPPPLPKESCLASDRLASAPCACGSDTCAVGQFCDAELGRCITPTCPDPPVIATSTCICHDTICYGGGTCNPKKFPSACAPKCSDVPSSFWTSCVCGTSGICGVGQVCRTDAENGDHCESSRSACPTAPELAKGRCACGFSTCDEGQVCNRGSSMCLTPNCPALPIPNDYVSPKGLCVCGDVICGSWESCDPATSTCMPICPAALAADTKCLCGKETCQAGEKCSYETATCTRKS